MSLSLRPHQVRRYAELARLLRKYGRSDLVRQAGLEESLVTAEDDVAPVETEDGPPPEAEELATDLEALGPTYVKLGQLLSTRADLLPAPYLTALSRLQDKVTPFSYDEVEAIVTSELGVRVSKAFASFD